MGIVYVDGIGGLGNCLFQLAAAIFYCEKFNMDLFLVYSDSLLCGTSNKFGRNKCFTKNNEILTYDKTIFSKLKFITTVTSSYQPVWNNYTNNKLITSDNIFIKGYNQNLELFLEYAHKIPKYLNIDDVYINNYIDSKYGDITNSTAICIRIGADFAHMKKINKQSYINGLEELKRRGESIDKLFIMGDTPTNPYFSDYKNIDESDIVQFYFGLRCKNYILSESTFHLWIAYLGTDFGKRTEKNVICFNDTDITNRKLNLDTFICLPV